MNKLTPDRLEFLMTVTPTTVEQYSQFIFILTKITPADYPKHYDLIRKRVSELYSRRRDTMQTKKYLEKMNRNRRYS